MEIEGEGWGLRFPGVEDSEGFFELYSNPVAQQMNGGALGREACDQLLAKVIERNSSGDGCELILESPLGCLSGLLGFSRLEEISEFGICTLPVLWGTGIAFEVASAFLQHAAWRGRVGVVEGFTHQDNLRALAFIRKLGFGSDPEPDDGWVRLTRALT